jgi:hypothetical protein
MCAHQPCSPITYYIWQAYVAENGGKQPATLTFTPGYTTPCVDDDDVIAEAVTAAKAADVAIVFVGLPAGYEVRHLT